MTNTKTNANTNPPTDFASLFIKGVERAAELQKKSLDDAVRQNAESIAACKKAPEGVRAVPGMFDLAGQAFGGYIEAQKIVIDHIVQQTAALVESAKDRGNSAQKVAADFTKIMQQSIERAVEVQKKALDLAAKEAKAAAASERTA
jgi:flagellar hook-basal body complex protein FliE